MDTIEMKNKKSTAIDNIHDFNRAIESAQFDGSGSVEVTQKFFDQWTGGKEAKPCRTTGHPGVFVFVEGRRKEVEREYSMDTFEHYELDIAKKREAKRK